MILMRFFCVFIIVLIDLYVVGVLLIILVFLWYFIFLVVVLWLLIVKCFFVVVWDIMCLVLCEYE